MKDKEIKIILNENGVAELYDDTYDVIIHCTSEEEQNREEEILKNAYKQKWIPCSSGLPEEAGFYIVTKRQRSGEIQVALGTYQPLFKTWSGNGNFKDVLAWMPMPEPYKENEG